MLIGIDFDNTIADYDRVFSRAAVHDGFLAEGTAQTKLDVRAALQQLADGDRNWMRLQGRVYGAHMADAVLMDGVAEFLDGCRQRRIPVRIVSHKTEYGHFDAERISLRDAAWAWLAHQGFFDPNVFGLTNTDVYFESTRDLKVQRIAQLGCTHFIDDLPEVFSEPGFPATTQRLLFADGAHPLPTGPFNAFARWSDISLEIFDY